MKLLPPRRHLIWIIPLFILLIVVLSLLIVAMDARKRFTQQAVIPVSPDMRMRLVAAMTTENPRYNPDPELWRKTKQFIFDNAPNSIRSQLPLNLFPSLTLHDTVTSQGMQIIFELDRSAALRKIPHQDTNGYLKDHGIHQLRLQYGPHSYSQPEKPSGWIVETNGGTTIAYTGVLYPSIPTNVETLKLQTLNGEQEVTHEVQLRNPLYHPAEPKETSATLPEKTTLSPEEPTTGSDKETP